MSTLATPALDERSNYLSTSSGMYTKCSELLREEMERLESKLLSIKLENGSRLQYLEYPSNIPSLRIAISAGSIDDGTANFFGRAHFVEHLVMHQYEKSMGSGSKLLGLKWNGSTGKDFSSFSVSTITPSLVEVARNMLDAIFSDESVENKDSVEQERRLIGREIEENASTLNALRIMAEYLLTHDSRFSHPVTGFPETLETITQKDLGLWKLQHYVAPKTAMTIVGEVSDAQLSDLTEMLKSLPTKDSQDEVIQPVCHQREMSGELPRQSNTSEHWAMFAFPAEAASDPTTTSTSLLFDIATDPAGSRLSRLLRHDTGAAYSLYRRTMTFRDLGYCVCAFKTSASHYESVLAKTRDLFETMRESGPSEEEVETSRLKMTASLLPLLEQPLSLSCLLEEGAMYKYNPLSFSELNSGLEALASTKIKKFTERLFDPEKMVVVTK